MDRELPKNEIYRQRLKTLITIIGILLILIASYYLLQKILKGKVDQSTIVIASVERGSMQNRVTSYGQSRPLLRTGDKCAGQYRNKYHSIASGRQDRKGRFNYGTGR